LPLARRIPPRARRPNTRSFISAKRSRLSRLLPKQRNFKAVVKLFRIRDRPENRQRAPYISSGRRQFSGLQERLSSYILLACAVSRSPVRRVLGTARVGAAVDQAGPAGPRPRARRRRAWLF
ncbi:MAG: hypothetical protein J3K34DRAFT_373436, partial [Monoraphidium minutum]